MSLGLFRETRALCGMRCLKFSENWHNLDCNPFFSMEKRGSSTPLHHTRVLGWMDYVPEKTQFLALLLMLFPHSGSMEAL